MAQATRVHHDPKKVRRRRIEAGLLQIQLAERAGCTQSQISEMENGSHGKNPPLLLAVADALGCTVADLLADEAT